MSAPAVRLHRAPPASLQAVDVVLVRPSHPGNIGACARAMRVMGLRNLVLVAPRLADAHRHDEARARASGATDVLAAVRLHDTLADALADVTLAVAVSADVREFGPPPLSPEEACDQAAAHLRDAGGAGRVAFVFGAERTGLAIDDVQLCQRLCSIAGDPDYNSLNLAQAVQVISYVLRRTFDALSAAYGDVAGATGGAPVTDAASVPAAGQPPDLPAARAADAAAVPGAVGRPAPLAEVEGFHQHLEQALIAVGYLDPATPRKLMPRMRRLFARAQLEREEVNLLRGICRAMEEAARRNGR